MPILLISALLLFFLCYGAKTSARSVANRAEQARSRLCAPDDIMQASKSGASVDRNIETLRSLFALYQSGALTKDEFEGFKAHLLSNLTARG